MRFPDLVLANNLAQGLQIYVNTPDAVLIDVRTLEEYSTGHVPGSLNVPLDGIEDEIYELVPDADTPVFLYCRSGNRSVQAAALLREAGYDNAVSIGGVNGYKGELKK